tara:strand:+ start:1145 stop:1690 length:546 start_codon:yes stop_codon:yes gene_type:complete
MHSRLPNIYCFINNFNKEYIRSLDKKIGIIYRNYDDELDLKQFKNLITFCKLLKKKIFLANKPKIALQLKCDGVYIPSFNKKIYYSLLKDNKNFKIIGSAHNHKEIKEKEKQGVELIFLSPLFKVLKSTRFLDVVRFNNLSKLTKKNIIALGGINKTNFKKLKLLNIKGFSSISFFKKKGP